MGNPITLMKVQPRGLQDVVSATHKAQGHRVGDADFLNAVNYHTIPNKTLRYKLRVYILIYKIGVRF